MLLFATYGVPTVICITTAVIAGLKEAFKQLSNDNFKDVRCIIHQKVLWPKVLNVRYVNNRQLKIYDMNTLIYHIIRKFDGFQFIKF